MGLLYFSAAWLLLTLIMSYVHCIHSCWINFSRLAHYPGGGGGGVPGCRGAAQQGMVFASLSLEQSLQINVSVWNLGILFANPTLEHGRVRVPFFLPASHYKQTQSLLLFSAPVLLPPPPPQAHNMKTKFIVWNQFFPKFIVWTNLLMLVGYSNSVNIIRKSEDVQ